VSGYNGFSKSNNAVAAEADGRFPASVVARKLNVPTEYVRERIGTGEWHHSSKFYNVVKYYDLEECAEWLDSEDGRADFAEWRAAQKPRQTSTRTDCRVEWLEWVGTRNHPRAIKRIAEGCTVIDDGGAFYKIILPDGSTLKKKKDCKGLNIN
jgi:hypothetical protein